MKITLYHYTNAQGAEGIFQSRKFKMSDSYGRPRDSARHGKGVYLTSKSPIHHSKQEIALNNFDDGMRAVKRALQSGRVDCAIGIDIDSYRVRKVDLRDEDRDVYLYPDDDLQLTPDLNPRLYVL